MEFIGWFWTMWYSLLGLVVVLFWYVEFSGAKFAKKSKHHLSDGDKLLAEVKLLPYHTRLRHHVVGDGGMY